MSATPAPSGAGTYVRRACGWSARTVCRLQLARRRTASASFSPMASSSNATAKKPKTYAPVRGSGRSSERPFALVVGCGVSASALTLDVEVGLGADSLGLGEAEAEAGGLGVGSGVFVGVGCGVVVGRGDPVDSGVYVGSGVPVGSGDRFWCGRDLGVAEHHV